MLIRYATNVPCKHNKNICSLVTSHLRWWIFTPQNLITQKYGGFPRHPILKKSVFIKTPHVSVILCHTSQQSTVKQIFLQMPTIWWVTTLHCEVHLSWAIVHQSSRLSLFNVWDQTTGQFYPGVAISEEASSGQNRISTHMSHTGGLHCSALQWCLECISKEVRLHNAMHCNGKCWVTNTMATVRNASPLICQEAMTE